MRDQRNSYLRQDKTGLWLVRIQLPPYMRSLFGNRTAYYKSTGTHDVREARIVRDTVIAEFKRLRETLKPSSPEKKIESMLSELRGLKAVVAENPHITDNGAIVERCPTLCKIRDLYLLQYAQTRKLTTLSKVTKAVDVLLDFYKKRDFELNQIDRTMVTKWIEHLKNQLAPQTIGNYLSALGQLVDYAVSRYHDAPSKNVFKGHKIEVKRSIQSYEAITPDELNKIYPTLNSEMQAVTAIGALSGMRLNEICSLRVENILRNGVALSFEILEGKTKNAKRLVPVHSSLVGLIEWLLANPHDGFLFYRASITNREDGKRSTWHTQQFTRAKRKVLGEKGTEHKVFHSLRHAFISQLDRAGVPEDRIALIVGHERGKTESFKTYSDGAELEELQRIVNLVSYPEIEQGL
ncbi:tyrosine-type recombinase/integrase [Serratia rhizosphaerae]